MAEIVRIADIKQRVAATRAKLSATSDEGPKLSARLLDLLEAVEKTLLHNQAQIRRLRRTAMALAVVALLGWLAAALLVADRFYRDGANGAADVADARPVTQSRPPDPALASQPERSAVTAAAEPGGSAGGVDGLLREPQAYEGREVTVTGSVIQLLSRYRLRSQTGPNTIVVEVDQLPPADRDKLEAALAEARPLRGLRARITGRVERGEGAAFQLAATEIVLLD